MANTFYTSKKFSISDYKARNYSLVDVELTLPQLALNPKLRVLFQFIPILYRDENREVDVFASYLTALEFGYNEHREKMKDCLLQCKTVFIQVYDEEIAKKIIEIYSE